MIGRHSGRSHLVMLVALSLVLFVVLSVLAPSTYPTGRNLASMALQMTELGILGLAIALTFLIGGIDLSVVAVANASALSAAATMGAVESSVGRPVAVLLGVVVGLSVGAVAGTINGLLVSRLDIHPIVITLATLTLFTGIATGLTGGSTVFGIGGLDFLGGGTLLGVPIAFLLFVALSLLLGVVSRRTPWGFRAYAVGASDVASRYGRFPVARVKVLTYLASGVLAATAGLVILARTDAANVSFGSSYLIIAILVAVLAGVDPYGGRGRIALVVLAVAAMQQLSTGLNLALRRWDGANFAADFAWGVLLIVVLAWSQRGDEGRLLGLLRRLDVVGGRSGGGGSDPSARDDDGEESHDDSAEVDPDDDRQPA